MTAAVILAAGESRRMGSPKLLLEHEGQSLLRRAVLTAGAVSDEVIVVVGAYPELYSAEARRAGARVVLNPAWQQGMGGSLQRGLDEVSKGVSRVLLLLADQPFVPVTHLEKLLALCEAETELVFSFYDGVEGPPAVLARQLLTEALLLPPDCGLKKLRPAAKGVKNVALADWQDIDTPHDQQLLS